MAEPRPPLIVDLDGTLIKSDMMVESLFALAAANPLRAAGAFLALVRGKAAFKSAVADGATADPATLPYDEDVLAFVREENRAGRTIHLASAANHRHADAVAAHLGLFDKVFGSSAEVNLSGGAKAELLVGEFGDKGFDYIGNERRDIPVWDRCANPAVANAPGRLLGELRRRYGNLREFAPLQPSISDYVKALRVHQWLKNLLVFVPLLAAHETGGEYLGAALLAFAAFSLCASAAYLFNDLTDLTNDRAHPTKRGRPLASGMLPVKHAVFMMPGLLAATAIVALFLSPAFFGMLAIYFALTLAYSMALKRRVLIDVLALAVLYTLRVIAGGVAAGIEVSAWLMAFSMFIFLCLAIVKRTTELAERAEAASNGQTTPGRAYVVSDRPMLGALSSASGFAAVVVLALYINSPDVHDLYGAPELLWLVCLCLLFWISRLLFLAHRGKVHEDPVVFALTDRTSWGVGAVIAVILVLSI
jgi:4-hydroxybenzoate polyprenyltransferase